MGFADITNDGVPEILLGIKYHYWYYFEPYSLKGEKIYVDVSQLAGTGTLNEHKIMSNGGSIFGNKVYILNGQRYYISVYSEIGYAVNRNTIDKLWCENGKWKLERTEDLTREEVEKELSKYETEPLFEYFNTVERDDIKQSIFSIFNGYVNTVNGVKKED